MSALLHAISQALIAAGVLAGDVGPAGYVVGNALAASNLVNRQTVIVDCVNPVPESRRGWQATARSAGTPLLEVELVCSDGVEHRRRVEARTADIQGHDLPSWHAVMGYDYAPWHEPHIVIDAARLTADEAVGLIGRHMDA